MDISIHITPYQQGMLVMAGISIVVFILWLAYESWAGHQAYSDIKKVW